MKCFSDYISRRTYDPADGPPRAPDDFEQFCSGSNNGSKGLARAREVVARRMGGGFHVDELSHGSSGMLSFVATDEVNKYFVKIAKKVTDESRANLRREHDNLGLAAVAGVTTPPLCFD